MNYKVIKTLRKKLGMTQEEFAAALGVSFATVNRWEKNRCVPLADRVRRIEELCGKRRRSSFVPIQVVIANKPPDGYETVYPWREGEHLLYLGEIANMPGHVAVVDKKGKVQWGYHDDNFRHPTEEEV